MDVHPCVVLFSFQTDESQDGFGLKRTFTHAAHKAAVKSLACAGPFMASGGADDLIHLYDMKSNRDLGFLMIPGQGAVTCLSFYTPVSGYTPTHLLAGCADGTLTIWKAGGGWECLKTFRKGHLGEITGITIHPSGALALSTSRDGTLRLWDLVKGRAIFTTKVEKEPGTVLFAPSGLKYAIQAEDRVALHSVDVNSSHARSSGSGCDNLPAVQLCHPRRVTSVIFGSEDSIIITGTEDGLLNVWNTTVSVSKPVLVVPKAHDTRIKAMALIRWLPCDKKIISLATGSSDGVIKVWKVESVQLATDKQEESMKATCQCQVETRARITTLCAVDPIHVMEERLKEEIQLRRAKHAKQEKKRKEEIDKNSMPTFKKRDRSSASKKEAESKSVKQDKVVSFIEPTDIDRQKKKMRKIKLNADRAASQRQKGASMQKMKKR
jgi:protein MAK11